MLGHTGVCLRWLAAGDAQYPLRAALGTLVDAAFDTPCYRDSYPLVFGPQRRADICMLEQDGELAAALAVLPLHMSGHEDEGGPPRRALFACIGSVCVRASLRGQGLAKVLLAAVCRDLERAGYDGAGLFAADHSLYAAVGFAPAQADRLCSIADLAAALRSCVPTPGAAGLTSLGIEVAWQRSQSLDQDTCRALWDLARQSWSRGHLGIEVDYPMFVSALCETPLQILTARTPSMAATANGERRLLGCLLFEKGADFQNTWHGALFADQDARPALFAVVAAAHDLKPDSQILIDNVTMSLCGPYLPPALMTTVPTFMTKNFSQGSGARAAQSLDFAALSLPSLLSI